MQGMIFKWLCCFQPLVQCLVRTFPVAANHTKWLRLAWLIYLIVLIQEISSLHEITLGFYKREVKRGTWTLNFCQISCLPWKILFWMLQYLHFFLGPYILCRNFVVSLETLFWEIGAWNQPLKCLKWVNTVSLGSLLRRLESLEKAQNFTCQSPVCAMPYLFWFSRVTIRRATTASSFSSINGFVLYHPYHASYLPL
jgi:hypothetical protein